MKNFNKVFQNILRNMVLLLAITASPFGKSMNTSLAVSEVTGNQTVKKVEDINTQACEERSKQMVYITKSGKCYHKDTGKCFSLKHSKIKIPLKDAIEEKYKKCIKCFE